ncbi:TAP-like protein-domain-containing protein [Mycena amicta]|nr:TAP-like protein-domain-containing protein [Mycena amicta]
MLASLSRETKAFFIFLVPVVFWVYWQWGPSRWGSTSTFKPRLSWKPCNGNPTFQCGYLEVPTDYNDPTAGTSRLALTKYPATCAAPDRLGIILTNYGGPGVSGRDASFGTARRIQNMTGNRHDIVSFDQRGLGHSSPHVDCFGSGLKYQMFKTNTVFETTFSVPKDPFSEAGRAEALALEEAQGIVCSQTMGAKALGYMSTTTTIYDMEEISRVMEGEKARINFWGGVRTIVGQYLASILPHKAGRIYIDGVVPADIWTNQHYESQALVRLFLTDSEKTYQLFLTECFKAGPQHCALAKDGDKSPSDIGGRIDDFIDRLQRQPIHVTNHARCSTRLQMPEEWGIYAEMLASAINDKRHLQDHAHYHLSVQGTLLHRRMPKVSSRRDKESFSGWQSRAGDALPYKDGEWPTAERIVDDILVTLKDFPRFGATVPMMEQHGGCQFWPGTGVGPTRFRKTLSTPMLLVANSHDPVTPYAAAKIVLDTMGASARLILQETAGHSYIATMTDCTANLIRRYFVQGIVPTEQETRCPREITNFFTDKRVFGVNPTILKSILGEGM